MSNRIHPLTSLTVPENRTTERTSETGKTANACFGQFKISCVSIPSVTWSLYSKSISALYSHKDQSTAKNVPILITVEPASSEGRIRARLKIGNSCPKFSSVTWIGPTKLGRTPLLNTLSKAQLIRLLILASCLYCKITCASNTLSQSVLSGGWWMTS